MEGRAGRVVPIEVKSGKKVRSHAALDKLLTTKEFKIRDAVVLCANNVSREGKILYLPWYMTCCLDELTDRETDDFSFAPASLPR